MIQASDIDLGKDMIIAKQADARLVGAITAEAFLDDPFNLWLFRNQAGIESMFGLQARRIYVPRGFSYRMGEKGACMWQLPGQDAAIRKRDTLAFAWTILSSGGPAAVRRALATGAAMEHHHPAFPHAYLFSIGLRPEFRGKGLGKRLIGPVLDACDVAGIPAYLENSKPENRGFYRACGFESMTEFRPLPDSPPLEAMVRQPRRS